MTRLLPRHSRPPALAALGLALLIGGCARVTVDPIEVKPIHITVDVNHRIDQRLDNFFAFQDEMKPAAAAATTQPASAAGGF